MLKHKTIRKQWPWVVITLAIVLSACNPVAGSETVTASATPPLPTLIMVTQTATAAPAPTSVPLAASVAGEGIPLSYFQNEMTRYRDALPQNEPAPSDTEIQTLVLNYLVDQLLLAQAARDSGHGLSDQDLQARIDQLLAQLGSGSALTNWMSANHYDDAEFRLSIRLAADAAWQRDQIINAVPESVEQVRARQIFTETLEEAEGVLTSLQSGTSFDKLAWEYNPETGGELGWFPRGYLLFQPVEDAAFALPEGTYSEIIQSEIGYHILMVIAHEDAHPLTTDARLSLQSKALENWLQTRRNETDIQILNP